MGLSARHCSSQVARGIAADLLGHAWAPLDGDGVVPKSVPRCDARRSPGDLDMVQV